MRRPTVRKWSSTTSGGPATDTRAGRYTCGGPPFWPTYRRCVKIDGHNEGTAGSPNHRTTMKADARRLACSVNVRPWTTLLSRRRRLVRHVLRRLIQRNQDQCGRRSRSAPRRPGRRFGVCKRAASSRDRVRPTVLSTGLRPLIGCRSSRCSGPMSCRPSATTSPR
jgi:hypothetical protein